jgi:acetyltransferase-like isoleucine patch superfamily enzyme
VPIDQWIGSHAGVRTKRLLHCFIDGCLWLISWMPTHAMRVTGLRLFGASIGRDVALGRGIRTFYPWKLTIASHTVIGVRVYLDARGGLKIGSNCNISAEAAIWTAEHDIQSAEFAMTAAPVVIGDRTWICFRSIVLPGVTIGEGCVVAAGSVVTGDLPPFSFAGRVPAEVIGKRNANLTYELGRRRS